jgi:hypothetical protein
LRIASIYRLPLLAWPVDEIRIIATLRLLFARQAKGKRKLVLWGCFAN